MSKRHGISNRLRCRLGALAGKGWKVLVVLLVVCVLHGSVGAQAIPRDGALAICMHLNEVQPDDWRQTMSAILDYPYVRGLHIYFTWRSFEPTEGSYQWDILDYPLAEAQRRGKHISFCMVPQVESPQWVLDTATTYEFEHIHPSFGWVTSPVPWGATYKTKLRTTIEQLANRYDGHECLHYVMINGPSSLYGVETNFPVKTIDATNSAILDFTHAKFIDTWREFVDFFSNRFVDTTLALGMHYEITVDGIAAEDPANIAAAENIRTRFITNQVNRDKKYILKLLGLSYDNPRLFPHPYVDEQGINTYLALVWDVINHPDLLLTYESAQVWRYAQSHVPARTPAELRRVIDNGVSHRANWLEIKWPDFYTPWEGTYEPYVPTLQYADESLYDDTITSTFANLADSRIDWKDGENPTVDSHGHGQWTCLASSVSNPQAASAQTTTLAWDDEQFDVNAGSTVTEAPYCQRHNTDGHLMCPAEPGAAQPYVARRWTSAYEGPVYVAGYFESIESTGDGVDVFIYIDKGLRFYDTIAAGEGPVEFLLDSVSVFSGTEIDFVVSPRGSASGDRVRFFARINPAEIRDVGPLQPFWRADTLRGSMAPDESWMLRDIADEWTAPTLDFPYPARPYDMEIPLADHTHIVRLLGGYPQDWVSVYLVGDLAYRTYSNGPILYRWRLLQDRLDPYLSRGYNGSNGKLTLVIDNVPWYMPQLPYDGAFGQAAIPRDYNEWYAFIHELCVQIEALYGQEVGEALRYRIGTEINWAQRWQGTHEQYEYHYDCTVAAIKEVFPQAKVGLYNILGGNHYPDYSNSPVDTMAMAHHCTNETNHWTGGQGTPVDFVPASYYYTDDHRDPDVGCAALDHFWDDFMAVSPQFSGISRELAEYGMVPELGYDKAVGAYQTVLNVQTLVNFMGLGVDLSRVGGLMLEPVGNTGHQLLSSNALVYSMIHPMIGGDAYVVPVKELSYDDVRYKALCLRQGGRTMLVVSAYHVDPTYQQSDTVELHLPQWLLSAAAESVHHTGINRTNDVYDVLRQDLLAWGLLKSEYDNPQQSVGSVKQMATDVDAAYANIATNWNKYAGLITDTLTLKPFTGSVTAAGDETVVQLTVDVPSVHVVLVDDGTNLLGFADLSAFWNNPANPDCLGDHTGDCYVDLSDLTLFFEAWLQ